MTPPTLETDRFILRGLRTDHVTPRYASWLNPETARMGIAAARQPQSLDSLREFIAAREGSPDVAFFGIFTKIDDEHIGNVKFEPIDRVEKYAVVGILVGEKTWWGKGVTAEVFRVTARWLRDSHGIQEIVLGVMKDNLLARRSYEKVGFRNQLSTRIRIDPAIHESMVWDLTATPP